MDYKEYPKRDIMCIDCKSFFASVESVKLGLNPLTSYLCVVSHADRKGGLVLASTPKMKSEYGIKTGSRMFQVPKYDKRIKIVPPRMGLYLKVNGLINEVFKKYTSDEYWYPYSIDESFIDVSGSHKLFGSNEEIAKKIQQEVWQKYKIPLCIGIGDNPLLAKLCLDNEAKNYPPYIATWHYQDVPEKLWQIRPITNMWGIGKKTAQRLERLGITSVKQLANANPEVLKRQFGVMGLELYHHANGIDQSILSKREAPKEKSYGLSQVLPHDYLEASQVKVIIHEMAGQLAKRLRKHQVETRCIHLMIGYSRDIVEKGFSHQMTIYKTNQSSVLEAYFTELFEKYYQGQPVRTVALTAGKLVPKESLQLNLFEAPQKQIQQDDLDKIVDKIQARYGITSLIHASSLTKGATAIERANLLGGHRR
ncbi:DNA polymerase V [Granulicatella balaenopterae]|uniref:DNA polymerase V n=1 Tax=Granulicatella balaenopterae TaxID=137733 RepID=A0A1H9KWN7_9LACT|nr:Y-family DNA polymerase [Granulicatella balaenopterae]SER03566.1 DNA polymerase V [Granulicatella balaenopterae]